MNSKGVNLFLGFFTVSLNLFSQTNFVIDSIYLPGVNIKKVTSFENGDIWFLCSDANKSIYRIDNNGNLENKTTEFALPILDSITDIVSMGNNEILIGTYKNYAYYYKNGVFTHIDTSFGLALGDSSVNSLTYEEKLNGKYIGIATNGAIYTSGNIEYFLPYFSFQDARLLSKNQAFMVYAKEENITGLYFINSSGTYGLFNYNSDVKARNISCGNVYLSGSNLYSYEVGTDSGYFGTYGNYAYPNLTKQKIYNLVNYVEYKYIVAADSGLYLGLSPGYCEKINLSIDNFSANDVVLHGTNIVSATDTGLFFVKNIDCSIYNVDFHQSHNYLSIQEKDTLTFTLQNHSSSDEYVWDFGDGFTTTIHFPEHLYSSVGNYKVQLVASNGFCFDTISTIVVVYNDTNDFSTNFSKYINNPFGELSTENGVVNIIDADGDNDLDVFIPYTGLFENYDSNSFYLKNTGFNLELYNSIWGDLDNDGLNDIIAGSTIYKNLGNFNFQSIEISSHYPSYSSYTYTSLSDIDNNGYVDIICGSGKSVSIFYNNGGLLFEQFDSLTIIDNYNQYIEDVKSFDIDNDNDFDLLICTSQGESQVFINDNGKLLRRDFPIISDISSYGGPVGDINNDRKYEFYTFGDYSGGENNVYLLLNSNDSLKKMENTWLTSEFSSPYNYPVGFNQATFSDLDNNGYLDCLKHVWPPEYNRVFMNLGDNIFVHDISNPFNKTTGVLSRSIASADITNDGFPEILVGYGDIYHSNTDEPNSLFINTTNNNKNYIKVKCLGSRSNLNAIGAKVSVKCTIDGNDVWQQRQIISNTNKFSQEGFDALFGVAENDYIDSLVINWPSGVTTIMVNLYTNKYYQIIEPDLRITGDTITCENVPLVLSVAKEKSTRYKWYLNNTLMPNDTLNALIPAQSGFYKCQIINPDYQLTTNNLNVIIKPVSKAEINFADSSGSFCEGDSILIQSNNYPGAMYHWQINTSPYLSDTNHNLYIDQIAKFYLIIENQYGCFDTSNVLIPTIYFKPDIGIYNEVNFCSGEPVYINIEDPDFSYNWSNGDTTSSTSYETEGTGFLILSNEICSWNYNFEVIEREYPIINLGPDTTIRYKSDYYPISNCNENYTYLWNDGNTDCNRVLNYIYLNEGENIISVKVSNQYSCTSEDIALITYRKSRISNLNENEQDKISVFPVPATNEVNICLSPIFLNSVLHYELFNSAGIIEATDKFVCVNASYSLDVSKLQSGLYTIRVFSDNELLYTDKILIVH